MTRKDIEMTALPKLLPRSRLLAFTAALLLATAASAQQAPVAPVSPSEQVAPAAPVEPAAPAAQPTPAASAEPTAPAASTPPAPAATADDTGPGPRVANPAQDNATPSAGAASQPAAAVPAPSGNAAPTAMPGVTAASAASGEAAPAGASAVPAGVSTETVPGGPRSGAVAAGSPDDALPASGAGTPNDVTVPSPAAVAPAAKLPHDLTPYGMFMAADYIVKGVMIGLAFASLVTWTIWLAKGIELMSARSRAQRGVRRLERAGSLAEVVGGGKGSKWPRRGPVAALVDAALREEERSSELSAEGIKERTQIALHRIETRAGRTMQRGTGLLATIGSTAPFVGLFGTVWGIMNAFIGISKANTTNLAVVAPGIAEALLATAIGLVAAIPAVIIYNVFARAISGYRAVLADASAEVLRHLSRDLDRREQGYAGGTAAARLRAAE